MMEKFEFLRCRVCESGHEYSVSMVLCLRIALCMARTRNWNNNDNGPRFDALWGRDDTVECCLRLCAKELEQKKSLDLYDLSTC